MSVEADTELAARKAHSPRGALLLMFDPVFGSLFWGKLLSSAGVWVHSIVAAIVVFEASGSALMVGMVSVAQFAPQMFLSLLSGKWADRGHAPRQILLGRVMCVAGSGSLALWMWIYPDADGGLVTSAVLLASVLVGLGFVVGGPAMQSIIPALIRPGELATAMALNTAPMTIARIVGPALGAFVAAHLGAAEAFTFATGTHLVFVVMIVLVRFPSGPGQTEGVDYSVRAAWRHVLRDRPLLLLLIACTAVGFGTEPSMTLAPAMADELDGGARLVGEMSTAFGIGAGLGLVLIATANRYIAATMTSSIGLWLMVAGWAGVSLSPTVWLALPAFAVAGFGFGWAMTGISTLVQERAPDELRGRIMAFWLLGFVGSRPFAAALVGVAADALTVRMSFLLTGALLMAIALLCQPRRLMDPVSGD